MTKAMFQSSFTTVHALFVPCSFECVVFPDANVCVVQSVLSVVFYVLDLVGGKLVFMASRGTLSSKARPQSVAAICTEWEGKDARLCNGGCSSVLRQFGFTSCWTITDSSIWLQLPESRVCRVLCRTSKMLLQQHSVRNDHVFLRAQLLSETLQQHLCNEMREDKEW